MRPEGVRERSDRINPVGRARKTKGPPCGALWFFGFPTEVRTLGSTTSEALDLVRNILCHLVLHGIDQLAEILDLDLHGVAVLHPDRGFACRAYTCGRARNDNVTRFECHALT